MEEDKKYRYKYWLTKGKVHELHFVQFYEDKVVLRFEQDENDADIFWYTSELLNVEHDCKMVDDIHEAMEDFEDMIVQHFKDEINYLQELIEQFNEEDE